MLQNFNYTTALVAYRKDEKGNEQIFVDTEVVCAPDENSAKDLAMKILGHQCPMSDGWKDHNVIVKVFWLEPNPIAYTYSNIKHYQRIGLLPKGE